MKKLLSVFLAMVTVVLGIPMAVAEVDAASDGNYAYTVSKGEAVITGINESVSGNIVIPDTLGGYPVTSIGYEAFIGNSKITGATVPGTVRSIGAAAFDDCVNLKTVNISYGVTTVANSAFRGCENLTTVTIPDSVTYIGDLAFDYCTKLTNITIPYGVTYIGRGAFWSCESLTGITIPDGVTTIYEKTFSGCTSLKNVKLGKGVRVIDEGAFYGCTSLRNITVGENITSIDYDAFYECYSLANTIIQVTDIAKWCENDHSQVINMSPKNILSVNDAYVTDLVIPEGTTSIYSNAFSSFTDISSITIPDSVTSVGSNAFGGTAYYNNSSNWEDDVLYIDNHLIKAKETVSGDYTVKDGTITIADCAFENCLELTGVTVPNSVVDIGSCAFQSAEKLSSIILPDRPMRIGMLAFRWSKFYNDSANWDDKVLYIGKHLVDVKDTISGECVVKDGTLSIADYSFGYKRYLTSIVIPDSVKVIDNKAFYSVHSMKDLYYAGSKDDWDMIEIGESNTGISISRIHYNAPASENHYECEVIMQKTCTEDGTGLYTCPCGYSYEGVITAGHNLVHCEGKAPSCTESGHTAYVVCTEKDCGYTTYVELPAGHDTVHNEGKIPTCTESGFAAYVTCARCDYSTYKELSATGEHKGGTATCTAKAVCDVCHGEYGEIDSSNHKLVQYDGKAPTCTESGFAAYEICELCGDSTYEELTAIGHSIIQHESKTPTCTEIGWNAYEACENCDHTTYAELTPNGHSYENGVCAKCGESEPVLASPGDANGDSKINLGDVSTVLKHIAKWDIEIDTSAADATADGKVNLADASLILKYIAKWDVVLV